MRSCLALLGLAFLFAACSHSAGPVPDRVAEKEAENAKPHSAPAHSTSTRYGEVQWQSEELFSVRLNGKIILQEDVLIPGMPSFATQGRVGSDDFLIFRRYSGDGCPETTLLLVIGQRGRQVHEIGNCNAYQLRSSDDRLELFYPGLAEAGRKPQRWQFRNGRLSRASLK